MSASSPTTDKQPLQKRDETVSSGLGAGTPTIARTPTSVTSEPLPRPSVCTEHGFYRFLTVVYSMFNFVLALAALIIGIWALNVQYEPLNGTVMGPTVMTITVALLIALTSPMGVAAGRKGKLMLLRCYIVIIVVIFVFQVVLGITAFTYRQQLGQQNAITLRSQLHKAVKKYNQDDKLRMAVDRMQESMSCCGVRDAADWETNGNFTCRGNNFSSLRCSVPDSCCISIQQDCGRGIRENLTFPRNAPKKETLKDVMEIRGIQGNGCVQSFRDWNEFLLDILGATSLAYAIIHIVGMFAIYMLVVQLEDKEQLFQYRSRYYNS